MSLKETIENPHFITRSQPAGSFLEGFPIGNGRLAAMVLSSYPEERIFFNHEWLWTARWRGKKAPDESAGFLPELKQLLRDGKYLEATDFGIRHFAPRGGKECRIDSYLSAGFLSITPDISPIDHSRTLDMEKALVRSTLRCAADTFTREIFASSTDGLIHIRNYMQNGTPFSGVCSLGRLFQKNVELSLETEKDHLLLRGTIPGGTSFQLEAFLHVKGGKTNVRGSEILFEDVEELTILVDAHVDKERKNSFPTSPGKTLLPDWRNDLAKHVENWQKYFFRSTLSLPDDKLISQYFHFGKYLFLSSLICGELPPNLQGKWNMDNNPCWSSDYHLNINLQMNYWGCCPLALEEFNKPFFDYVDKVAEYGKLLAAKLWGCRGTFFAHSTDVWAQGTPEARSYSLWLCAAPWLAQHYMQHYRYTLDETFLKERAWPFLRECALFFEDILEKDEAGIYQLMPSQSPENCFKGGGTPISLCISSSCDIELMEELFREAIFIAEKLGEKSFLPKWREILTHLPPLAVGRDGRLLEWGDEKFEEVEMGHRHISHLVGLFPGHVITERSTPELYKAALRSLEVRLENFHEDGFVPGWSRALLANYFALSGDGERAVESIKILAEKQSSSSLLDLHPPKVFQIDGNLGILSAVVSLLVQMKDQILYLLPALPSHWEKGKAANLHTEQALSVNIQWEAHELKEARILAAKEVSFFFRKPENCTVTGGLQEVVPGESFLKITLKSGEKLLVSHTQK